MKKFFDKPMHFFGLIGSIAFFIGFLSLVFIIAWKTYDLNRLHAWEIRHNRTHNYNPDYDETLTDLVEIASKPPVRSITNMPFFYVALTCMIVGMQMFSIGFMGELISQRKRKEETIIKDELK